MDIPDRYTIYLYSYTYRIPVHHGNVALTSLSEAFKGSFGTNKQTTCTAFHPIIIIIIIIVNKSIIQSDNDDEQPEKDEHFYYRGGPAVGWKRIIQ
jgi:hypothetical protein